MYKTLRGRIDVRNLRKKCDMLVKKCTKCQQEKNFKKQFNSSGSIHSPRRNKDIAADIIGPIELNYFSEGCGKRYILVIMDRHSRFCKLKSLENIGTHEMKAAIDEWIEDNGRPETLLTDQGRQFISHDFKEYLEKEGIKQ